MRRVISGPTRLAYLDNLRVIMVAGVIAGHAIAGYAGMNWTYADVAEGEMGAGSQAVFGLLTLPFAVFMMALFFLVAGLLTPASLDRKGARRFARNRLIRLGIPLAAFTFVLWPLMTFGLYGGRGLRLGSVGCVHGRPDPRQRPAVVRRGAFDLLARLHGLGRAATAHPTPPRRDRSRPATYAAFMIQGLPLIVAALALRAFEVPLEVKALLVAALGIAGSFASGWSLVTHTRLGRFL